MTDNINIISRLRCGSKYSILNVADEAAAEIERLRKDRDDAREFIQAFVNYANGFASRPRAAVSYNDLVDFIQSNLDDANKFLKKNTDGK